MIRPVLRLERSGRNIQTVFDLLGRDENAITAALGWTLVRSPSLVVALAKHFRVTAAGSPLAVHLQQSGADGGYTDVEIEWLDARLIIEAKRGWALPTEEQLSKYRPRLDQIEHAVIATLSEASRAFARMHLPKAIKDVPVVHCSWASLAKTIEECASRVRGEERRLLREFNTYLRGAIVSNRKANEVYCVSIGSKAKGWPISFKDIVEDGHYFHPYGVNGWTNSPPEYLAFRWDGFVQRIHHVDGYKVVDGLHDDFPELPRNPETTRLHALYDLGPSIPLEPLKNGHPYRSTRLWVAIDLLLTSKTLKDALDKTKCRNEQNAEPE